MKRKIGALLLVLAMIAAYMPAFAFAETTVDSKMLLFEEATELEENGDYLIVAETTAMTNVDGELGSQTVTVNNGRIVISEDDAEKSVFSVEEWRYLGERPHHSAKLKNNGKYLSGNDETKVLNLVDDTNDAKFFNTWDGPNRLCGLGFTLKWLDDSSTWKAVAGEGISAVTYKKVDSVTVSFSNPFGVDPDAQVLKNGEKATKPADPEKEGYLFMGWYNGNKEWNFNTPVTEDITLVAKWDKAVKYELADELEEDGEYIIVNRNSANNDARVMQAVGDNLNFFNASVNAKKEVIIGENQSENSLFKASGYREEEGLKKAKLALGDKYIGKNKDDRLILVDEKDGGIFNTYNYDNPDGYKLCGYGYWIRCTGNNEGQRDGGWWPTDEFGSKYTGAYLYKKASYEAEVAVKDYEKLCTEEDPFFEADVTGTDDFPCDIEYTISREEGKKCGEYTITAEGAEKQANYSVSYVEGTLTIKHVLKKVEGVQPTSEKAGYRYAYKCVGCGEYFEDADGTKLIGDQAAYDKWISKGGAGYLEKTPTTGDENTFMVYVLLGFAALISAGYIYKKREN